MNSMMATWQQQGRRQQWQRQSRCSSSCSKHGCSRWKNLMLHLMMILHDLKDMSRLLLMLAVVTSHQLAYA